jgi:Ca-activated chloride channel homolog
VNAPVIGWTSQQIVLQGMKIEGIVKGLLATLHTTQEYRNDSKTNIEAVYTFPLPTGAVLQELTVLLANKELRGRVVSREAAEESYEAAIGRGDSAVRLESSGPGLYTMNVGNVLAGERIVVRIGYSLALSGDVDKVRLAIPTTVAPRFGSATKAGLEPHQVPVTGLMVANRFALSLSVLDTAGFASKVSSPTHKIQSAPCPGGQIITFADGASWADRDLILIIAAERAHPATQLIAPAKEGALTFASFFVQCNRTSHAPRTVKLVIDCSGSMAGDSIKSAKAGARAVLDALRPQDRFAVLAFGSNTERMSRQLLASTPIAVEAARIWINDLKADMGGTELGAALNQALELGEGSGDILLITDGEVWDVAKIVETAKASSHRIFSVGVGSSPAGSFLSALSSATGAACTLVTPGEQIEEAIWSQCQRIFQGRTKSVRVDWQGHTAWTTGPVAIAGDGFAHFSAELDSPPRGPATLHVVFEDESQLALTASQIEEAGDSSSDAVTKVAAGLRLEALLAQYGQSRDVVAFAVAHQLQSPVTNYILVVERGGDAAKAMPDLHVVPNMLAAGWGGTGTVLRSARSAGHVLESRTISGMRELVMDEQLLDIPAFLRAQVDDEPVEAAPEGELAPSALIECIERGLVPLMPPRTRTVSADAITSLAARLPHWVWQRLHEMAQTLSGEQIIVAFVLALTALLPQGKASRSLRKRALRLWLTYEVDASTIDEIGTLLSGIRQHSWGPQTTPA